MKRTVGSDKEGGMGQMIVCVTALVALRWGVCVMPRRTHVYASARAYRYVAFGHVSDWIVERNRQMRGKAAATDG